MSSRMDALDQMLAQIPTLRCPHCERRQGFNYILPQQAVYGVIEAVGNTINVSSDQQDCVEDWDQAQLFCLGCKTQFPVPKGFAIIWDGDTNDDNDEEDL